MPLPFYGKRAATNFWNRHWGNVVFVMLVTILNGVLIGIHVGTLTIVFLPLLLVVVILIPVIFIRKKLSVGSILLALVITSLAARLLLFPYEFEVTGELQLYLNFAKEGIIPGFNSEHLIFLQKPAIFVLNFYLVQIIGLDPLIALKLDRLILGLLNVLLVYMITYRVTGKPLLALGAAALFSFSLYELNYIEGDQFKNFIGVTFSLSLLYMVVAVLKDHLKRIKYMRLIFVLLLLATMASHRLYPFLFLIIFAVVFITSFLKRLGLKHFIAALLAGVVILLILRIASIRILIGIINIPQFRDLVEKTIQQYKFSVLHELLSPGILFYNIWSFLALLGGYFWLRREPTNRAAALLFTIYSMLFFLSKGYLFGFGFVPGRWVAILAPFLCIFSVYAIYTFLGLNRRSEPLAQFIFLSTVLLFIIANLVLIDIGGERLRLITRACGVSLINIGSYLLGNQIPWSQGLLLLIFVILVIVVVAMISPRIQKFSLLQARLNGLGVIALLLPFLSLAMYLSWNSAFIQNNLFLQLIGVLYPFFLTGHLLVQLNWKVKSLNFAPLDHIVLMSVVSLAVFITGWLLPLSFHKLGWIGFEFAVHIALIWTWFLPVTLYMGTLMRLKRRKKYANQVLHSTAS